jgi:hypothetical protein
MKNSIRNLVSSSISDLLTKSNNCCLIGSVVTNFELANMVVVVTNFQLANMVVVVTVFVFKAFSKAVTQSIKPLFLAFK